MLTSQQTCPACFERRRALQSTSTLLKGTMLLERRGLLMAILCMIYPAGKRHVQASSPLLHFHQPSTDSSRSDDMLMPILDPANYLMHFRWTSGACPHSAYRVLFELMLMLLRPALRSHRHRTCSDDRIGAITRCDNIRQDGRMRLVPTQLCNLGT